jgi:hypothetical protein
MRKFEEGCAMAPMVEAARDGRLDARDQASVARHLEACASCRALRADLERLGHLVARPMLPEATPLEHQRGRKALLTAPPQKSRPEAVVAALAVAAVLLVVAGGFGVWRARAPAVGVEVARRMPAPPRVADVRGETRVQGIGGARFTRVESDGVDRVELEEGVVDLRVRPLVGRERFLVATKDAEVEVRGTAFRVEAHAWRLRLVSVSEGKVEVRYAGALTMLGPGEEFSAGAEGPTGDAKESSWTSATEGSAVARASASATARATASRAQAAAARGRPETSGEGDGAKAFAEGMRLVGRGDYAAGAERLEAYRRTHPSDARAEDAAYMAILALQRAGRREDASAAAKRYLQDFPNGYRRGEVQSIAR